MSDKEVFNGHFQPKGINSHKEQQLHSASQGTLVTHLEMKPLFEIPNTSVFTCFNILRGPKL